MTWKRYPLETEAIVAALDSTDTVDDAAARLGCSVGTLRALFGRRHDVCLARMRQRQREEHRRIDPIVKTLDATDTVADAASDLGISTQELVGYAGGYRAIALALDRQRDRKRERVRQLRERSAANAERLLVDIRDNWHEWPFGVVGAKLRQLRAAVATAKGKRK